MSKIDIKSNHENDTFINTTIPLTHCPENQQCMPIIDTVHTVNVWTGQGGWSIQGQYYAPYNSDHNSYCNCDDCTLGDTAFIKRWINFYKSRKDISYKKRKFFINQLTKVLNTGYLESEINTIREMGQILAQKTIIKGNNLLRNTQDSNYNNSINNIK